MSRKILVISSLVITVLISAILLLRGPLLDFAIRKVHDKVKDRYNAELTVGESGYLGFRDVYLRDISLVPENGDTLLRMKSFKARVSIASLLRLKVRFRELVVDTTSLTLVRKDSSDNFLFLLKKRSSAENPDAVNRKSAGFDDKVSAVLSVLSDVFNERITFRQFRVEYRRGDLEEMVSIPELFFDGALFQSSVITSSKEGVNLWLVNGNADPGNNKYSFKVNRVRGGSFALPFIDLFDGFKVTFDSAEVRLQAESSRSRVELNGDFEMHNMLVNHWRIAPGDVRFPNMDFHVNGFAAADSVGLTEGTVFVMDSLPVSISASYSREPSKRFRFNAGFSTSRAQQLFDALPYGMFSTFNGFRADGGLEYKLQLDVPLDQPENLVFDSKLQGKNFRIRQFGSENFSKMNLPFSFLAMDGDRPVRSFIVGVENPYFTPLQAISPYLQNAVLTAEDPSFFQHGGFVEEAFRESMATNIKKRRFVRGGSTISMQLAKNVFLSRNKTISRKLEEALIVWLVEKNGLCSKERMFEVYLNIIEWGPDVYGVGEASRFYFAKTPSDLTLSESIFLASIIPSPKLFKYRFSDDGQLKPYLQSFYKVVSERLVRREKISQAEADSLQPFVKLSGPALNFILPADTLQVDTLELVPPVN